MICFQVADVGNWRYGEYDPEIIRVFSNTKKPLPKLDIIKKLKKEVLHSQSFREFPRCKLDECVIKLRSGFDVKLVRSFAYGRCR